MSASHDTVYLDTHVLVMMGTQMKAISRRAKRTIETAHELRFSPAVVLEMQFLREIGRLNGPPLPFINGLKSSFPLLECDLPFSDVAAAALDLTWTRDPFDRLIAAQAMRGQSTLITKDANIRTHCTWAFWD